MRKDQTSKPALVIDPYTGKTYDVSPLFQLLNEQNIRDFLSLSNSMEDYADQVPHLLDDSQDRTREMMNVHFTFLQFKSVFRRIEER